MFVANNAQIREADQWMTSEYAFPSLLLMESAARKSAEKILELYPAISHFLVLCGKGNNGGDGLATARYLHLAGKTVWCLLMDLPGVYEGDAKTNLKIVQELGLKLTVFENEPVEKIEQYLQSGTVVIDAMLGTGIEGELRDPVAKVVTLFNGFRNEKIALDMPSGLSGNTGQIFSRPLACAHTLTFQLPKICHFVTPASLYCGHIHVVDIGIYPEVIERLGIHTRLIDPALIRQWHRPRSPEEHKGSFGHVLVAGGSKGMSGAVAMATQGATEIGAGLCTAFIPGAISCSFHRTTLENMSLPYGTDRTAFLNTTAAEVFGTYLEGKRVIAIGPGLGLNDDTRGFLKATLEHLQGHKLVLDADALNILAESPELWDMLPEQTILTPHPGEMARLMGEETGKVQANRFEMARKLATERKLIIVLKGAGTIIASPDGNVYLCSAGNPGMATGGTGDVLTGAIAGLLSQGYAPLRAAAIAVFIHATTGDLLQELVGPEGITAQKVMRNLGRTLKAILDERNLNAEELLAPMLK